ncbi:hypothetical protein B2J93_183 [Marssonina coronariae]|uniref:Uncharacterized protein n=1 Tax=Diplocarpon coronariae TaxID=2795749 RepID=A0A218Z9K8_9HELO|nr:hypothetical protein B2J93_183 [Marssonina coronariae]
MPSGNLSLISTRITVISAPLSCRLRRRLHHPLLWEDISERLDRFLTAVWTSWNTIHAALLTRDVRIHDAASVGSSRFVDGLMVPAGVERRQGVTDGLARGSKHQVEDPSRILRAAASIAAEDRGRSIRCSSNRTIYSMNPQVTGERAWPPGIIADITSFCEEKVGPLLTLWLGPDTFRGLVASPSKRVR